MAMLLLLLAGGCFITGKAKRDGWETVTPTTMLILIVQWSDDPWAMNLLSDRYDLWLWQARWVSGICIDKIRNDRPVTTRQDALRILGYATEVRAMEGDDVTEAMVVFSSAVRDANPMCRVTACLFVPQQHVDWNAAAAVVTPMLNDPDRRVRNAAVLWFGGSVPSENASIDSLLAALTHCHADVRATAASSLGSALRFDLRTAEVMRSLSQSAQLDSDPSVREWSLRSLSEAPAGAIDTTSVSQQALHDPVAEIRQAALELLYAPNSLTTESIRIDAALDALDDPDPVVRNVAVALLSWPDDPQLVSTFKDRLTANLTHADPEVRAAMMQLLQQTDTRTEPPTTQPE